ncbi:MAG: DUF1730 domain-containing protein [Tissierellia bacterium]|nr:DUF1730 domain-containing protein [Tissierellia bacterium]
MIQTQTLFQILTELGFGPKAIMDPRVYIPPKIRPEVKPYLSKEQQMALRPEDVLPGVRSILVLGMPYRHEKTKGLPMATGALSRDYHRVFEEKVDELAQRVNLERFQAYADTGPLFDRYLALASGLGFVGKNQNIIHPTYGSFFYIGYILTTLDLRPTEREVFPGCGDCTLCLDACPAKALGEKEFAFQRCISHLTQTKELADEYKMFINSLYGCDICQKVCPWNQSIQPSMKEFVPLDIMTGDDLFLLSKKDYDRKYGTKAFSWRPRTIIKRNAILNATRRRDPSLQGLVLEERKKKNPYLEKYIAEYLAMR